MNKYMKIKANSKVFGVILFIGFIITTICMQLSHGDIFAEIFFYDTLDTGMDFFHSIEYTRGRAPYEVWNTLYPPLANCIFYFLFHMIPKSVSEQWADTFESGIGARGTSIDLRVSQTPMFLFICYIIISVMLIWIIVNNYYENKKTSYIMCFGIIFNYGMLYAYERGNIVIYSFICSMMFVFFQNSKNKYMREIALMSLAFAAGFKIYPAFLGFLLLYNKEYKRAIRTVIYGIIMFIVPFFAFQEKLSGLPIFFNTLFKFQNITELSYNGFSFDKIFNTIIIPFQLIWKKELDVELIITVGQKLNIVSALVLLGCGFILKKNWQKIMACCLAMVVFSNQEIYMIIFMLLPLCVLIHDEDKVINRENTSIVIALSLLVCLLPLGNMSSETNILLKYIRFQIIILILICYTIFSFFKQIMVKNNSGRKLGQIQK